MTIQNNCGCIQNYAPDFIFCEKDHYIKCGLKECMNQVYVDNSILTIKRKVRKSFISTRGSLAIFCCSSHRRKSSFFTKYCPTCADVQKHSKAGCLSCIASKRYKRKFCEVCKDYRLFNNASCTSCTEKSKNQLIYCNHCQILKIHRNGVCLSCSRRKRRVYIFCGNCLKDTIRDGRDGKCMSCTNMNVKDRFCAVCNSITSHKRDTCLSCANSNKWDLRYCPDCRKRTKRYKDSSCQNCLNATRYRHRIFCNVCQKETTFINNKCLSHISRGDTYYCDICERDTFHATNSKTGVKSCKSCETRRSFVIKFCEACKADKTHTIKSGVCFGCSGRKTLSQKYCENCYAVTTHRDKSCCTCASIKAGKKKFKNGRANRSKIEMMLVEAIGFTPKVILGISVDGSHDDIVFEYDGDYYHKTRIIQDSKNSIKLLNAGYTVIRVRGDSLPMIEVSHPNFYQNNFSSRLLYTTAGLGKFIEWIDTCIKASGHVAHGFNYPLKNDLEN